MSYRSSKCKSDIKWGFALEKTDGGILSSETWVAGEPDKRFSLGVSIKKKVVYGMKTFRCIACGYLDSYVLCKQ
jgi:hypothetical protein